MVHVVITEAHVPVHEINRQKENTQCVAFSQDKKNEFARNRTWNLQISSQTRYSLRHKTPRRKNECQTSFCIK